MTVKLFELGDDRLARLDKEWISTIKEFKKILSRDRGSKGDTDGRRKLQATKEFTFMYHYCDYASKFGNFSEDDKLKASIVNAELADDFNYKKDEDLLSAMVKYKEMQESPALQLLTEAKEGLHHAHKVVKKIRTYLEIELENLDLTTITEDLEESDSKKKKLDPISKITNSLKNLMSLTNEIAPALKTLKLLEEEVKKELGDKTGLRGGREKGEREEARPLPSREELPEEDHTTAPAGAFADL